MPLAGVTPNVISYSATISSCEKGAQWQHALALWQEMPSKHVLPNLYTHNSTISSLEKGAQWHMAVMIFGHLPAAKIRPDVVTFSATMSACCSAVLQCVQPFFLGRSQVQVVCTVDFTGLLHFVVRYDTILSLFVYIIMLRCIIFVVFRRMFIICAHIMYIHIE